MRIGIIFGGQSREREISFAGGRTVFDNLSKSLFTPVPVFIDSLGNFILLEWQYLYKGTIRDFYPANECLPESPHFFQIYVDSIQNNPKSIAQSINKIGRKIQPEELKDLIDFAFLTLHGPYGEDGNIQGILEWHGIPYSGAGILPSSIGIDKVIQRKLLADTGFITPKNTTIKRSDWLSAPETIIQELEKNFGFPLVVKAPHQGSSIGVSIVRNSAELKAGINRSFFIETHDAARWKGWSAAEKRNFLVSFTDIREGLGFPVLCEGKPVYHPEDLWKVFDERDRVRRLESPDGEAALLVESFIEGREFSCIVIQNDDGSPIALPPTEIRKSQYLFDYRSKYLPGISRKITPMELPDAAIQLIRKQCEELFISLNSQVYGRIDGFFTSDKKVFLNDPNTTSGMLPSSFFFHQAAEIGLNPSQFLTYIISKSLDARLESGKQLFKLTGLKDQLMEALREASTALEEKVKVAVIMGGFSSERHISVESGRNIFEKLSSSTKYLPIPVFLTGNEQEHLLYQLPINMMLKDNADDIREKILNHDDEQHQVIEAIKSQTTGLRDTFAFHSALSLQKLDYQKLAEKIDFAFIALHGRPGEDGAVQERLEKYGIPYNGSGVESSRISINKYETNELLKANGILVAEHALVHEADYLKDPNDQIRKIEDRFSYPFIAKPADDGCSSAVKKIKNRDELQAFCEMMFRSDPDFPERPRQILKLKYNEEFPQKKMFLIEELIGANGAAKFMEITGGMLTHLQEDGSLAYEVFEPSEALATGEVLSLEEKFLAGEGQNITPARFATDPAEYERIAASVKATLQRTAELIRVEGYCRIDAFVRVFPEKTETIIIEINSLPGMTPATAIFHQSALNNMKPYEFIDKIIEFGFARQGRR